MLSGIKTSVRKSQYDSAQKLLYINKANNVELRKSTSSQTD